MRNLLAADIKLGPAGGLRGFGPLGLTDDPSGALAPYKFATIISTTIGVMTIVAIIWFIVQLFIGAVGIVGSGGDKQKLESAKSKITTGLTGLVVVIAGVFILGLVGTILGIDFLDPAKLIICIAAPGGLASCQ